MANIPELQRYAERNSFGLTAPLRPEQVSLLAETWKPLVGFHEDERYHPIPLSNMFTMVLRTWEELSAEERDSLRLRSYSEDGNTYTDHDPPWVFARRGYARRNSTSTAPDFLTEYDYSKRVYEVYGNGVGAQAALSASSVNGSTVVSSGPNGRAARRFFGDDRGDGGMKGTIEAPLKPRATAPRPTDPSVEDPEVTFMASLFNLIDLLKYELRLSLFADNYPPDRLRGAFDIVDLLFHQKSIPGVPWSRAGKRAKALEMIEAEEAGENALDVELPIGWAVARTTWAHLVSTTFLEYSFFYAYNDWERVQVTPFDNTHEGDDEGCCLVFDRRQLAEAALSEDPEALLRVAPKKLLTSVHEEWLGGDLQLTFPEPSPADSLRRARDYTSVVVYSALGSHATYLTEGDHDVVDLDGVLGFIEEHPLEAAAAGLAITIFPVLALIVLGVALYEHFTDTVDETSGNGFWAGPTELIEGENSGLTTVLTLPMSFQEPQSQPPVVDNIYSPGNTELLTLRAYDGVWGGHNSFPNVSPAFIPKSARYFRNLIR